MITAEQIRAARAILRMEQADLAVRSGLSVETVKRLERQDGRLQATSDTITRIANALELAGIEFLDEISNGGPGVRTAPITEEQLIRRVMKQIEDAITPELIAAMRKHNLLSPPHLIGGHLERHAMVFLYSVAIKVLQFLIEPKPSESLSELSDIIVRELNALFPLDPQKK